MLNIELKCLNSAIIWKQVSFSNMKKIKFISKIVKEYTKKYQNLVSV